MSGHARPSARPPRAGLEAPPAKPATPGRNTGGPRPPGRHYLRRRAFAAQLVHDAGITPGELVLDLGAGGGILTRALAAAGARVLAVELDPAAADALRRRFAGDPRVDVREADATRIPLPREPFSVVANLPFAAGTAILRRLLGDPRVPLDRLDAIVEWGLAAKRTAVWPSTLLGCAWGAWHELTVARRVPRACFAPPPSADAAVLRAVRRADPLVPPAEAEQYLALLRRCFEARAPLDRVLPRTAVRSLAHELGFDPRAEARDLDVRQWAALYAAVRPATRRRAGSAPRRRPSSRR
ncbi:MAG TPA: rRNA adenine dimethyltransferase family protein [Gaiellaceae bacterium]|nr:rRNA adenine dimethyltransferase family protein [Gaiellaceae bacterium]